MADINTNVDKKHVIIYGSTGFIGKYIIKELIKNSIKFTCLNTRIYQYTEILNDIILYNPTHIITAAGYPTPTNIDFYEDNKEELQLTNTTGNLILSYLSNKYNIHLTIIMSGCIYNYNNITDINYEKLKFTEKCIPNFIYSYYSLNRVQTEELLHIYKNICILRLRMPISHTMHPKSLITKIVNYRNVISIPNSMSVLEDVIKFIPIVINKKLIGKYNLVNSGVITHDLILYYYKKFVNRYYEYKIISLDEQKYKIQVPRSNCSLSNKKVSKYMNLPLLDTSIYNIMISFKKVVDKYHLL